MDIDSLRETRRVAMLLFHCLSAEEEIIYCSPRVYHCSLEDTYSILRTCSIPHHNVQGRNQVGNLESVSVKTSVRYHHVVSGRKFSLAMQEITARSR